MKKLIVLLTALLLCITAASAEENMKIVAPAGAPALAVCAMKENVVTISAETIVTAFQEATADFVIAPVNAGAIQFKKGNSTYRLAAVVTWGNLVFASQADGFTPEMINGRVLTLFGENTINATVAQYILSEMGIEPSEIEYLGGAPATQQLLLSEPESIVMTAEPAATAAKMKNDAVISYSLSDLYKDITGTDGFVQAGLFVRAQTIEEKPDEVSAWLEMIRASADRCANADDLTAVAADAVEMGIMPNEKVAEAALPGCHIRYVAASDAREQIEAIARLDPAMFGGELPADDFYYAEK